MNSANLSALCDATVRNQNGHSHGLPLHCCTHFRALHRATLHRATLHRATLHRATLQHCGFGHSRHGTPTNEYSHINATSAQAVFGRVVESPLVKKYSADAPSWATYASAIVAPCVCRSACVQCVLFACCLTWCILSEHGVRCILSEHGVRCMLSEHGVRCMLSECSDWMKPDGATADSDAPGLPPQTALNVDVFSPATLAQKVRRLSFALRSNDR